MVDIKISRGSVSDWYKEWKDERTICNEEDSWKEQSNSRDGGDMKYVYFDRQDCKLRNNKTKRRE